MPHRAPIIVSGRLLVCMAVLGTQDFWKSRAVCAPWELLCPAVTVRYPVFITEGGRRALRTVWWSGAYTVTKSCVTVSHLKRTFIDSLNTDRRTSLNDLLKRVGDLGALSSDLKPLSPVSTNHQAEPMSPSTQRSPGRSIFEVRCGRRSLLTFCSVSYH